MDNITEIERLTLPGNVSGRPNLIIKGLLSTPPHGDNNLSVSTTATPSLEDYEYDVNESLASYDWTELVPTLIVYTLVLLLGIFGNALIILTIAVYRRLKTITNIFLASLASADLLLVIICVPVNLAKLFSYTWTFGAFLCKFVHYMQNVSAICSVLTLTAMSVERYYAIVHPIKAKYLCTLSQARKVIICTWIASFFLGLPTLWIQIHLPVGERIPAFWCVRDWDSPITWQIFELYMLLIVLIIPLVIMTGTYLAIGREIWRVTYLRSVMTNESAVADATPATSVPAMERPEDDEKEDSIDGRSRVDPANEEEMNGIGCHRCLNRRRKSNSRHHRSVHGPSSAPSSAISTAPPTSQRALTDHRTARKVVKMLVAVVVLFTVCWMPYLIDNVLMSFEVLPATRTGPQKHMRIAFHLLSYINSCCNPLVYGFMSRNFRRGFKAALRLRSFGCRPCLCYCPSCCCAACSKGSSSHKSSVDGHRLSQRNVYRFSNVTRDSRITSRIVRGQDGAGYVRRTSNGAASSVSVVNQHLAAEASPTMTSVIANKGHRTTML